MKWSLIILLPCVLLACSGHSAYKEDKEKLGKLIQGSDLDEFKAVIVVPLENACSPCSELTLQEVNKIDEQYKSLIKLILTGNSYRIIDQTLEGADLEGFLIQKDGDYLFWKHGLVDNSPSYYFIDDGNIIEKGSVIAPEVMVFMSKLEQQIRK